MKLFKPLRRRLREPLAVFLLKLNGLMSLKQCQTLGAWLGALQFRLGSKLAQVAQRNISACFPDKNIAQQQELIQQSLIESSKTMLELGPLWLWPQHKVEQLFHHVTGKSRIDQQLQQGRGVIILAPHLGNWEVLGLFLAKHYQSTHLYQPYPIKRADDIMLAGRERFGAQLVPTDAQGVKALLKALKQSRLVGVLPDQDPGYQNGAFAPFFGIETNTMTLLTRLARKSKAAVIGAYAERLPNAEGFHIHFFPALEAIHEGSDEDALAVMNKEIERMVRHCPAQYQWTYKRFRRRPQGQPQAFYD